VVSSCSISLPPRAYLAKLEADFADFMKERGSERLALNCAVTAYHLHEWVWHDWLKNADLSLRQRRNNGSDSRQLSIQSRLQLLEGGLDFRWGLAIALIDEQSDYLLILSVIVPAQCSPNR